jgi:hypothetical protein
MTRLFNDPHQNTALRKYLPLGGRHFWSRRVYELAYASHLPFDGTETLSARDLAPAAHVGRGFLHRAGNDSCLRVVWSARNARRPCG